MAWRYLVRDFELLDTNQVSPPLAERQNEVQKLKEERDQALAEKRASKAAEGSWETKVQKFSYEAEERELVQLKREARLKGGFYREPEPKVLFVIRLKGINKVAPKPKKIMQLFRLRQINNGVFIKNNKATREMLKQIEPFVAYGYPSRKTIESLILKRGYGKVGKRSAWSRKRLLNPELIRENLEQYGITSLEDMIHEIHTCGPHFKQVANFLWPFKLPNPRGGWVAKRRGFCDPRGGDWGNREHLVNGLIKRMI